MTKDILSIALTFTLLAGGTAAIGSEFFASQRQVAGQDAVATVTLPTIVVTGKRPAPTVVASANGSVESTRAQ